MTESRPRIWGIVVLLAGVLMVAISATASADVYYSSPDATNLAAPCPESDPCVLKNILQFAFDDEVVLAPGDYYDTGKTPFSTTLSVINSNNLNGTPGKPLPVIHGLMHGLMLGSPAPPLMLVFTPGEVNNVELRVENESSPSSLTGLLLSGGGATARNVAVYAEGSTTTTVNACSADAALNIVSVLCSAKGGPGSSGLKFTNPGGNAGLRNLTAVATGPNSHGISAAVTGSSSGTFSVTASNVIAQGEGDDLSVFQSGGNMLDFNIDHSNFDSVQSGSPPFAIGDDGTNQTGPTYSPPLFVDATGSDFRETGTSPTVGSGLNDPFNGALALGGNARTINGETDMGAYQFGPAPLAYTGNPTIDGFTNDSALLRGAVDPNGHDTKTRFEYGTTTAYGSSVPTQDVTAGAGLTNVEATISDLQTNTVYHYRMAGSSIGGGDGAGIDRTFIIVPPHVDPRDAQVTNLRIGKKWRVKGSRRKKPRVPAGTEIRFDLPRDAQVTMTFERVLTGRKVKGVCRPAKARKDKKVKKCNRFRTVGLKRVSGTAGANKVKFNGKLNGKRLKPGRYRLSADARGSGLGGSTPKKAFFRIVP